MLPGGGSSSHPTSSVDVPGRPAFVDSSLRLARPVPAGLTPDPEPYRATRPDCVYVSVPARSQEMRNFARCFAYAYITPRDAPCRADPGSSIRRAIHAAAPRARFEILPGPAAHGADRTVRFCSPDDREAAMARQPFALGADGSGGTPVTVTLVREGETSNVRKIGCLAHIALGNYPEEQRNVEDIRSNCNRFGFLCEIDPACYAAPDLAPVRVVISLEHPRSIPREIRMRYASDPRFRHVMPVQTLKVWERAQSFGANGEYISVYPDGAPVVP